jgi:hypothetical protein
MHSQWEDITADRAAREILTAQCGRKASQRLAENYGRDMLAGQWAQTHQGIAYDKEKILRDGQNRFGGIIWAATQLASEGRGEEAEKFSVRLWVSYDVPEEAFPFFDGGKNRDVPDVFFMEGHQNSKLLGTVVRRISLWEAGHPIGNTWRPTRAEQLAVLRLREDTEAEAERIRLIIEAADFAKGWSVKPLVPSPGLAGFLWWLLGNVNAEDRDTFMEGLRDGAALDKDSPILLLRNRLHSDHSNAQRRGTRVRPETVMWLCLRAWKAWRTHEDLDKLQMPGKLTEKNFTEPR